MSSASAVGQLRVPTGTHRGARRRTGASTGCPLRLGAAARPHLRSVPAGVPPVWHRDAHPRLHHRRPHGARHPRSPWRADHTTHRRAGPWPTTLGNAARRAARDRSPGPVGTGLRIRSARHLVATTVDARLCSTLGLLMPAAVMRNQRARRLARVSRAARNNDPTAARNHPISPSARSRPTVIT
jgi:hypothetical protein